MSSRLTPANTLERARLDLKYKTRGLNHYERHRRTLLLTGDPSRDLSLGERAATSKGSLDLAVKASKTSENTRLNLDGDVPLAQADGAESKTLLRMGLVTSAGAFQSTDDSGEYAPVRRPLELLDLVRAGATDEGSVQYMRQTAYTSVAAETAEATSTTTGTKPEATLPFEQISSPGESIPSWVPVTTRALQDVDEMRGLIDDQLLYDARRRLEAQLLAGNGTSPNLRGLDSTTGVLSQAKGADSVPLALAKGAAQVIAAGYTPTAVALHPDDWVDGITVILANGGSSLSDVLEVPVIKTASVAAGTGYVGAWNQVVVWTRSTDIFVSRTHSDFLTRNLAAVLAELRVAAGVLAPAGFCRVTGI
jgi:Phage capsid family